MRLRDRYTLGADVSSGERLGDSRGRVVVDATAADAVEHVWAETLLAVPRRESPLLRVRVPREFEAAALRAD